jgi:glycosidase
MRHRVLAAILVSLGISALAFAQATTNPAAPRPAAATAVSKGQGSAPAPASDWWNSAVFYEVFVRSFKDSSTGPLANDGVGDIRGIIEKLDYLNDARPAQGKPTSPNSLGVTGIWLMPIHPSPGYHGYEVDDYYGVNPQYGTLQDFKELVAACHDRGIRVILDLVINHVSYHHPWFVEASANPQSPKRDWFIWKDTVPDWKGPWNENVWWRVGEKRHGEAAPKAGETAGGPFYYGIFSPTMPDINYRNEQASDAVLDAVRYWITKEDVDGYRLDAIRHLVEDGPIQENTPETHAWLKKFRAAYKKARPDAFTIGEVWGPSEQIVPYVGDELDTCFEFNLSDAIVKAARTGDARDAMKAQKHVLDAYPSGQYGRFLSNHDQTRVMTQLKGDAGAMRAAAAMLLLGPGVPFLYYGEEIGMTGDKPDENLRTPMQWTAGQNAGFTNGNPWEPLGKARTSVEAQDREPDSLLNLYRRLIRAREAHPALSRGGTVMADCSSPNVLAMLRHAPSATINGKPAPDETALVLVNVSDEPASEVAISLPAGSVPGTASGTEVLAAASVQELQPAHDGSVVNWKPIRQLAPRSAYVIIIR